MRAYCSVILLSSLNYRPVIQIRTGPRSDIKYPALMSSGLVRSESLCLSKPRKPSRAKAGGAPLPATPVEPRPASALLPSPWSCLARGATRRFPCGTWRPDRRSMRPYFTTISQVSGDFTWRVWSTSTCAPGSFWGTCSTRRGRQWPPEPAVRRSLRSCVSFTNVRPNIY